MTSDRIVLIAAWLPSDPIFVKKHASVEAQAIVTPMAASHVATSPNATLPEPRKSSIASTRPFVTHTVDPILAGVGRDSSSGRVVIG